MSQLDDSGYRRGGKDYEGSYASKGAPRLVRHILSLRFQNAAILGTGLRTIDGYHRAVFGARLSDNRLWDDLIPTFGLEL